MCLWNFYNCLQRFQEASHFPHIPPSIPCFLILTATIGSSLPPSNVSLLTCPFFSFFSFFPYFFSSLPAICPPFCIFFLHLLFVLSLSYASFSPFHLWPFSFLIPTFDRNRSLEGSLTLLFLPSNSPNSHWDLRMYSHDILVNIDLLNLWMFLLLFCGCLNAY